MRSNIITFLTTHLMRIKYVTPLHIPLTRIKSEFKCINNFDPTFDARQIEIKQRALSIQSQFPKFPVRNQMEREKFRKEFPKI